MSPFPLSSARPLLLIGWNSVVWSGQNDFFHIQSQDCVRTPDFSSPYSQNGQLVDCEEIFTEFDKCIGLELLNLLYHCFKMPPIPGCHNRLYLHKS